MTTQQPIQQLIQQSVSKKNRCKFSEKEDQQLIDLYTKYHKQWKLIANEMNRNVRQIRERYLNYLAPNVNTSPWTDEEELLLHQKVSEYGTSWVKISPFFQNR